ncbi:MAG: efflux RND transporter periplasmic adaptor subunit [Polyangiaceae bacterium]|nr:efflux RND transporter periplasmic adaptor subunit [Polyangiaceae bacterium]
MRSLVLFAAVSLQFTACAKEKAKPAPPLPVSISKIAGSPNQQQGEFSGSVQPFAQVQVRAQIDGTIKKIYGPAKKGREYQSGDRIKSGARLLDVDTAIYSRQVDKAAAEVESARASQIAADAEYKRISELFADDSVSRAELDRSRASRDAARAQLSANRHQLAEARTELSYCEISTPLTGVILKRNVEEGDLVKAGSLTFQIANDEKMKVVFAVPGADQSKFSVGQKQQLMLRDLNNEHFTGIVSRVGAMADAQTKLFDVEVVVENPERQLKQGMVARLLPAERESSEKEPAEAAPSSPAFRIPLASIVRPPGESQGLQVYTVELNEHTDSGTAKKRAVRLRSLANDAAYVEGLRPDELVIVRGATIAREGMTVKVVR